MALLHFQSAKLWAVNIVTQLPSRQTQWSSVATRLKLILFPVPVGGNPFYICFFLHPLPASGGCVFLFVGYPHHVFLWGGACPRAPGHQQVLAAEADKDPAVLLSLAGSEDRLSCPVRFKKDSQKARIF